MHLAKQPGAYKALPAAAEEKPRLIESGNRK